MFKLVIVGCKGNKNYLFHKKITTDSGGGAQKPRAPSPPRAALVSGDTEIPSSRRLIYWDVFAHRRFAVAVAGYQQG